MVLSILILCIVSESQTPDSLFAPSECFGSMVDDLGEFLESSSEGGISTPVTPLVPHIYWMRQTTAPTKTANRNIPSSSRRRSPSNSAPTILNAQKRGTKDRRKSSSNNKVDILKINHITTEATDETTELPGSIISPPKENNVIPLNSIVNRNSVVQNHVAPPNSKSDGDLLAVSKNMNNHIPNSHSESYLKKHEQEQCCTSFTTSNGKPHFNANNCILI